MKTLITTLLIAVTVLASATNPEKLNTAAGVKYLSDYEKEIIFEINRFRSNPAEYADKYIEPLARFYKKKLLKYPGDNKTIRTHEGIKALRECVKQLHKETPKPLMYPNKALTKAAADLMKDQARTGKTGHTGSDKSTVKDRIERYGKWQVRIAENIAYGNTSARQIVVFLLIDDGVKSRGHRANLLNPDLKIIGISTGTHPVYRTMCVMDFAGGIEDK